MSLRRIQARLQEVQHITVARLMGHQLRFHKHGHDDTAKCDAYYTGSEHHIVWGRLYTIGEQDLPVLDKIEGVGNGYERKTVTLLDQTGQANEAITYYATRITPELLPFDWYVEHVVRGAEEIALPPDYVEILRRTPVLTDSDTDRRYQELVIYNS